VACHAATFTLPRDSHVRRLSLPRDVSEFENNREQVLPLPLHS
jgi:hypothetical protein